MAVPSGLAIGTLGGMIGLGGAELRLPLLIALYGFVALAAVIVNKAASLNVVRLPPLEHARFRKKRRGVPPERPAAGWAVGCARSPRLDLIATQGRVNVGASLARRFLTRSARISGR